MNPESPRRRMWNGYAVEMDHPWDDGSDCLAGQPCPITRWIRADGLDTGVLWCAHCARVGVIPEAFYARAGASEATLGPDGVRP